VLPTSHEYVAGATTFSQCVSLIGLNVWDDEWLVVIEALQEGEKENKYLVRKKEGKKRKSDLVCEQYINASKLGANWDGQDFKNQKSLSQ